MDTIGKAFFRRNRIGRVSFMGEGAAAAVPNIAIPSLAGILTGRVLRDGELIVLILKPSRWYVLMNCFAFAAAVAVMLCTLELAHARQFHYYVEAAIIVVASRVMWAILNWMGRLYVLTNQRVIRLSGVLHIEVDDCPLRKVAQVAIVRSVGERLLGLGTIEIYPRDETRRAFAWQTVAHPKKVLEQIESTMRRAKQN